MGKYFGTDGFRGEANVGLTADHAYKVGRFLGWYFRQKRPEGGVPAAVVIGKDTRRSSYMFEYALAAGITASGADAHLLHVTTTPSVAYVTRTEHFDCGVMISASHNPYYDNGIKLLNGQGEKMEEEILSYIESYLDGELRMFGERYEELPLATRENIGRTVDYVSGRNRYIGYLIGLVPCSFHGLKVGLDCANGGAWNIAKAVFDALGAETHVIHAEPDGMNINRDAGSTHMEQLQQLVADRALDVGFAFDGDADRCLCVDEYGNIVSGDHILYILGTYLQERGQLDNNTVVTTVMSNFGLYKALEAKGIGYTKTQVGDKYVYEHMVNHRCALGGEQSGHVILRKYGTTGDGILTALKIMEVMMLKEKRLSELSAPVKLYPQVLKNIRVRSKDRAKRDPRVLQAVENVERALGDTGRILLRESGTEPLIRVMVEAPREELCNQYIDTVIEAIRIGGHEES